MSKKPTRQAEPAHSVLGRGDLASSLLYIFPLFLIYEIGVMFAPSVNGADFVTRAVFAAVGGDRVAYLAVHLVLAVSFLTLVLVLRRRHALRIGDGLPMVLESTIYALTLGSLIVVFMERVLGLSTALWWSSAQTELIGLELGPTGQALIASMGAGVHEELIFRLAMFAGLAAVLRAIGLRLTIALVIAAAISSVLFSLAHHIGPFGEVYSTRVFVYRALAGLAFAAIFYFRSLAHAVYAHFLYDVYVLVIHP